MNLITSDIADVVLIEPRVFHDDRGFFYESFQARKYASARVPSVLVQDNHSGSRQGVLRGLHYQIDKPQGKLVSVLAGEIYDVVVDLRRPSPTFGRWVGFHLSAVDRRQLWVPPGLAHGFYVLSPWAEVTYKVSEFYHPELERTLLWKDQQLNIAWPLHNGEPPMLSPKDAQGLPFAAAPVYDCMFFPDTAIAA
jgi:dTDP-4-dehydrorhamnose 3,5-epimerase